MKTKISDQEYFAIERFSNSALTNFKQSPKHYLHYKNNSKVTEAMTFGTQFHLAILEPDTFDERYIRVPAGAPKRPTSAQLNAKKPSEESVASITWWQNFNAQLLGGKEIISADDYEQINKMKDALYAHAPARELLDAMTQSELPLFWKDAVSGVEMKGKLDGVAPGFTLDLKTCENASPEIFTLDCFKRAYHRASSLYCDAREHNKMNRGDFYFIACEKNPPFGVCVFKASKEFINHGSLVAGAALEDVRYWMEMGSPNVGYEWKSPFGFHELNPPSWVK